MNIDSEIQGSMSVIGQDTLWMFLPFFFCSDSNLGEKKKQSCLYFSITFNWPVENAGVSLKIYKQIHHYVSH